MQSGVNSNDSPSSASERGGDQGQGLGGGGQGLGGGARGAGHATLPSEAPRPQQTMRFVAPREAAAGMTAGDRHPILRIKWK
jgi:hypothetical protein